MITKRVGNVIYVNFISSLSQSEEINRRVADIEYVLPMLTHADELNDKFELKQELAKLKSKLNEINNLPGAKVIYVDFQAKKKVA